MQRLDGQAHAGSFGVRQYRGDARDDLRAAGLERLLRRRAADEHDQGRANRFRFIDRALVFVDRGIARGKRRGGKEAASAQVITVTWPPGVV